ncbi:hypothetical protein Agub_g9931, partial [Astrephomene gubernaculifera]
GRTPADIAEGTGMGHLTRFCLYGEEEEVVEVMEGGEEEGARRLGAAAAGVGAAAEEALASGRSACTTAGIKKCSDREGGLGCDGAAVGAAGWRGWVRWALLSGPLLVLLAAVLLGCRGK